MDIKKLEYINVREIWEKEASDFTKWLAQNLDYLTDKLNFGLNNPETERQVGSFNIDIYCEDDQGNPVIIENQLEKTDHTHLGQILTYVVGAAAKTVIWISPDPRPEHAASVEWLNEITPVDMKWYLLKLEAIRVGNSPVSPLFTKVVGPSQEIKSLGSEKKDLAERHQKRLEFWEQLLVVLNEKASLFRNISPSTDNWLSTGSGVSGVNFQIVIRMSGATILLVIEKRDTAQNKSIFDTLVQNRDAIEASFGEPTTWRRMDDNISSRIHYEINGVGLKDTSTWNKGFEIITDKIIRWEQAFKPYIKGLK